MRDPRRDDDLSAAGRPSTDLRALLTRHLPQLEQMARRLMPPSVTARESPADVAHSVCGDLLAEHTPFEYRGEAEFQHWLQTVVRNKIRGRLRAQGAKKRAGREAPLGSDSQMAAAAPDLGTPSQHAMRREDQGRLQTALQRLPEHYRDVIVRARLHGQSRAQIAEALGRTQPSVRNLLNRALVQLAAEMDRLDGGAPR